MRLLPFIFAVVALFNYVLATKEDESMESHTEHSPVDDTTAETAADTGTDDAADTPTDAAQSNANESDEEKSHVVDLTDENFAANTCSGKWFVKFYAPWCPHCQRIDKPFKDAAAAEVGRSSPVGYGQVDCTVPNNKALCEQHSVEGYPTLQLFKSGMSHSEFQWGGERGAESLTAFARAKGPSALDLIRSDIQDLLDYKKNAAAAILFAGAGLGFMFGRGSP